MKNNSKTRIKALFIDVLIIGIFWFLLHAIFTSATLTCSNNYNAAPIILVGLFLSKDNLSGQSIGKRICKLKVTNNRGQNINVIKLTARNLFLFLAPIEFALLMYYDKRIGDKVFNTQVISIEKSEKITFKNILIYLLSLIISMIIFLPLVGL